MGQAVKSEVSLGNPKRDAERLFHNLQQVLHFGGESNNVDFYISAVTEYNPYNSTEEVLEWLRSLNDKKFFDVKRKPLASLERWQFNKTTGDLEHESGGFFAIRGLEVNTNIGPINSWSQPVIDQAEIGLLGFITKKIDGILYFLVQAKAEPGNINTWQLSPTVQATRSNFTRVHGGKSTAYIEYFLERDDTVKLIDQLQSEQGARFYKKRNRNTIVRIPDNHDMAQLPLFRWLTLAQIGRLLQQDNTVNMDARSVLSCISFDPPEKTSYKPVKRTELHDCLESSPLVSSPVSAFAVDLMVSAQSTTASQQSYDEIIYRLTDLKFHSSLRAKPIPLNSVTDWTITEDEILHDEGKYFSVLGVGIEADTREVVKWDQPIVHQQHPGIVGFVACYVDDVLHFLVQAKMECGNMDILELAPTVQCITSNYDLKALPPYAKYLVNDSSASRAASIGNAPVMFDVLQSEEGGRFYREENRNVLALGNEKITQDSSPFFFKMTLAQLKQFIRYNNYLNVEARSLLSCMRMV